MTRKDLIDELKKINLILFICLGQDNLDFNKKDEFIIYQGSHGDKGAEMADIIFLVQLTQNKMVILQI